MSTIKSLPLVGLIVAITLCTLSASGQNTEVIPAAEICYQPAEPCRPCENPCQPLAAIFRLFGGMCNRCTLQSEMVSEQKVAFRGDCETVCMPALNPNCSDSILQPIDCCGTPEYCCPRYLPVWPSPFYVTSGPPLPNEELDLKDVERGTKIVSSRETCGKETTGCDPGCEKITTIDESAPGLAIAPIPEPLTSEKETARNQLIFVPTEERTALRPIEIREQSMSYPSPRFF